MRGLKTVFFLSVITFQTSAFSANSSYSWDPPSSVNPHSVFFGESPKEDVVEAVGRPNPADKSYPWYCLEKGNKHLLTSEFRKAEMFYREAYSVGGPTRVLSGFKLVEAFQKMGRVDSAIEALDGLEKNYLVSPREFQEAKRFRIELLDAKRNGAIEKTRAPFTGREWVLLLSERRIGFVLKGMEDLRSLGIPVKESYQKYIFLLEEYFLANPAEPAENPSEVLADLIYERDPEARIAIDQWRIGVHQPTSGLEAGSPGKKNKKIAGAEWITMVHEEKKRYVAEAMTALGRQFVPMERSLYAYVDALDKLFTENPEFPAYDSVTALASYLYQSEPEARKVWKP